MLYLKKIIIFSLSLLILSSFLFFVNVTSDDVVHFVLFHQTDGSITFNQGIATNNNWRYFKAYDGDVDGAGHRGIPIYTLDSENNTYINATLYGKSYVLTHDATHPHVSDPFCSDTYLFVPCSNYPSDYYAICFVFWLSNLTELPNSPFQLLDNTSVREMIEVSSGSWWDSQPYNCYFSNYDTNSVYTVSYIWNYTFNPVSGFTYQSHRSTGKTEIQGMEFGPYSDLIYLTKSHDGEDNYIYIMNASTWSTSLDRQYLVLDGRTPYEGLCFDESWDGECKLHVSYGGGYFNGIYNWTIYNPEEENPPVFANFVSINNQQNGSVVQENHRWFNWTRVTDATCYSIRISNISNMNDVFLQLDNITVVDGWCTNNFLNISNSASPYVYNYWENSTYCFYFLPYIYNISDYGYDYYQVRAYIPS